MPTNQTLKPETHPLESLRALYRMSTTLRQGLGRHLVNLNWPELYPSQQFALQCSLRSLASSLMSVDRDLTEILRELPDFRAELDGDTRDAYLRLFPVPLELGS